MSFLQELFFTIAITNHPVSDTRLSGRIEPVIHHCLAIYDPAFWNS